MSLLPAYEGFLGKEAIRWVSVCYMYPVSSLLEVNNNNNNLICIAPECQGLQSRLLDLTLSTR